MNPSSWYYARNEEKHVRQIVIELSPESRTYPRVDSLTADAAFTAPNWAVTAVLDSPSADPVIFAKATGAIEMVDHKPADVTFAFYHLRHGGVFQIFVQVDSPAVRSKFGYPFLAEHARWLDETNDRRLIEALIAGEEIELCFVAPGEKGPCTPFFSLVGNVPTDCRAKLKQQWDELRTHHNSVEFRDFQLALQQYNQENPMEESPVLPSTELERSPDVPEEQDQELSPETLGAIFQALSSNDVKEGDLLEIKRDGTVEVDQGGLGLTDYDIVELYNHGIRKVGDIELTPGVYQMSQMELEMGAERQLSDLAADLIKQKEQKKRRVQKQKPSTPAKPAKISIPRTLTPIQTQRLVLMPSLVALSLNLFGLFVTQWSPSTYMLVNGCLIVAVGVYFAFRLDRAGAWQSPREELGGCIGGFFVIGIVLGVLAGALKLSSTIMLPIVFVSLCIYGLFQLAVYPRLLKAFLLFTVITKLPELVGSLFLSTGTQGSPVRISNILGLSLAMPVYATWVGMITAAVLDWRGERRGVATLPASSALTLDESQTDTSHEKARHHYQQGLDNADRQNWKEAAKDFAAAIELDRTSPTYLYSLAVARTECAPTDVGEEELQKYYLDVCALFEKAITLDTNRSELDKEAYKKVAYTCGALYRSLKQHEDALRLFKVGLKHHSRDAELLAGISWSQFDLGQIANAEKTVARLLELAPDSDDGRKLWKAIRKAQGRDLTSDLSEDLKRQIYKEFLEKQNQAFVQGYMDTGVSGKQSFEELVSDISGKSADAESKVRRFLLEKYGLKEFEFDLILKQGEREAWD